MYDMNRRRSVGRTDAKASVVDELYRVMRNTQPQGGTVSCSYTGGRFQPDRQVTIQNDKHGLAFLLTLLVAQGEELRFSCSVPTVGPI